jgi:hypothetical protein
VIRDDPEHRRSAAAPATRLCKKCSAEKRGGRKKADSGVRSARKEAAALVPARRWRDPERDRRTDAKPVRALMHDLERVNRGKP